MLPAPSLHERVEAILEIKFDRQKAKHDLTMEITLAQKSRLPSSVLLARMEE